MIKESTRIDEAKEEALKALFDAYGRSQATPSGMYCMMGRIDRAYDLAAENENQPQYIKAIKAMQEEALRLFAQADRALAAYRRVCRLEGVSDDIVEPECDCPHCKRVPTFWGK